jgi:hypothetical protein
MKGVLIISERKNPLTPYGIKVNIKLMEQDKKQTWLLEKLHELLPERYLDSSVLNRILTGQTNSPEVTSAIDSILGIEPEEPS